MLGVFVAACCVWGSQGGFAHAGSALKMATTRTYIKEYKIVDGFALPVTETTVNGVFLEARKLSLGRERNRSEGGAKKSERAGKRATAPAPPPTSPEAAAEPVFLPLRPSLRTISLCGIIREDLDPSDADASGDDTELAGDTPLVLVVEVNGQEVTYSLRDEARARELLERAGVDSLRAIVVGKVHKEDASPILRVASVIPVKRKTIAFAGSQAPAAAEEDMADLAEGEERAPDS